MLRSISPLCGLQIIPRFHGENSCFLSEVDFVPSAPELNNAPSQNTRPAAEGSLSPGTIIGTGRGCFIVDEKHNEKMPPASSSFSQECDHFGYPALRRTDNQRGWRVPLEQTFPTAPTITSNATLRRKILSGATPILSIELSNANQIMLRLGPVFQPRSGGS